MKARFKTLYRGGLVVLALLALGGMWAVAQTSNTAPAAVAVHPSGLERGVERLEEHYLTFGLDRLAPLREVKLLGEPAWKYLASLIYLGLAFYVAKFFDLVTGVWFRRLATRTETKLDDLLLDLLHGPVKVVVFVCLLVIGLNIFDWPERVKDYLAKGLVLVVAGSLAYLAIRIVGVLLDVWRRRVAVTGREADARFNDQLFSVMRRTFNAFIIIVAVLVTAQNIGINITAAITSLSIGGLAMGLAAQDTLANLFGAVSIFADKPFQAGDQVKLEAGEGIVEDVGLRSTRLRSPEGHLIAVPNKIMGTVAVTNITRRPGIKTTMNLVLARTLPAAKVKQALRILEDVYRAHPGTREVWISFNQFSAGNLNILVLHWWNGTDYQRYLAGMQEMNLAVKERFDAEGIAFA